MRVLNGNECRRRQAPEKESMMRLLMPLEVVALLQNHRGSFSDIRYQAEQDLRPCRQQEEEDGKLDKTE